MRRYVPLVAMALALVVAAALLTAPLPAHLATPRLSAVTNLGHFILYGGLTAGLGWALRGRIWWAFWAATALNGLCETLQRFSSRNANIEDFLRGLAGSLVAVACFYAFRGPRRLPRLAAYLALVVALSAWPICEAVPRVIDVCSEYRQFPVLCDFRSSWQTTRWQCFGTELTLRPGTADGNGRAGWFLLHPYDSWVVLYPLRQDWRAYRQLCFEGAVVGEPVDVRVELKAVSNGTPITGVSTVQFSSEPTVQRIRLPGCKATAAEPGCDLSEVRCFALTVPPELPEPRAIGIYRVWLE